MYSTVSCLLIFSVGGAHHHLIRDISRTTCASRLTNIYSTVIELSQNPCRIRAEPRPRSMAESSLDCSRFHRGWNPSDRQPDRRSAISSFLGALRTLARLLQSRRISLFCFSETREGERERELFRVGDSCSRGGGLGPAFLLYACDTVHASKATVKARDTRPSVAYRASDAGRTRSRWTSCAFAPY